MEWLVIGFYLFGTIMGGLIGYGCGKANTEGVRNIRRKLQSLADEYEVRLQDMDFENDKQYGRVLGANDVCYEMMNYIDEELNDGEQG